MCQSQWKEEKEIWCDFGVGQAEKLLIWAKTTYEFRSIGASNEYSELRMEVHRLIFVWKIWTKHEKHKANTEKLHASRSQSIILIWVQFYIFVSAATNFMQWFNLVNGHCRICVVWFFSCFVSLWSIDSHSRRRRCRRRRRCSSSVWFGTTVIYLPIAHIHTIHYSVAHSEWKCSFSWISRARVCVHESCEPSIHSVHCFGFVRCFFVFVCAFLFAWVRLLFLLGAATAITSSDQNQ